MEHLLLEDLVGQIRFDLADTLPREICLTGHRRPHHHVDVWVLTLVMVGGIPAEVIGRDIHRSGDIVAVCPEQIHPCLGVVVAQPGRILPFQGEDVRPHVASVLIQLPHGLLQVHAILVSKEAVISQALRPGPCGDVFHVSL